MSDRTLPDYAVTAPADPLTSRRIFFAAVVLASMVGLVWLLSFALSAGGFGVTDFILVVLFAVTLPWSVIGFWNATIGLFIMRAANPAAVYVTFARVVRPLLLRLAGAEAVPLLPLPVRAAFEYRKKAGRREYVRVKLVRSADGIVEAIKHAQEGAGIITSLTETDGLVELSERTTTVEPGSTVGFLSYAALSG